VYSGLEREISSRVEEEQHLAALIDELTEKQDLIWLGTLR